MHYDAFLLGSLLVNTFKLKVDLLIGVTRLTRRQSSPMFKINIIFLIFCLHMIINKTFLNIFCLLKKITLSSSRHNFHVIEK